MKVIKKIRLILRTISEFGMSKLEVEIARNQSALKRYEYELNQMNDDWCSLAGAVCCPGCYGGSRHYDLQDKIKRTRQNLDRLILKNGINKVFI